LRRVRLDVNGRIVQLPRERAEQLRHAAALEAADSSVLRDISLLLDRAIETERVVALQRQELRPLARLLDKLEHGHAFDELREALGSASGFHGADARPRQPPRDDAGDP
jgi:hypothetical protein